MKMVRKDAWPLSGDEGLRRSADDHRRNDPLAAAHAVGDDERRRAMRT
jgi:hypothetical protein